MGWLLTDAGAEVPVLAVGPVVVGAAVVAAHGLQLDLLDLHGLCDGRVGRCSRRGCQTWREETERFTHRYTSGRVWGGRVVREWGAQNEDTFSEVALANNKTSNKTFENNTAMNTFTDCAKSAPVRSQLGVCCFVGSGGGVTAGYRADGANPCVHGSLIFFYFFFMNVCCDRVFAPLIPSSQGNEPAVFGTIIHFNVVEVETKGANYKIGDFVPFFFFQ